MEKLLNLKTKFEQSMFKNPAVSLVPIVGCMLVILLLNLLGGAVGGGVINYLLMYIIIVLELVKDVICIYAAYMLVVKQNLFKLEQKMRLVIFVAVCFGLFVVTNLLIAVLSGSFYIAYILTLIMDFMGLSALGWLGELVGAIPYIGYYGLLFPFMILYVLLLLASNVVRIALMVALVLKETKGIDLFARLGGKAAPAAGMFESEVFEAAANVQQENNAQSEAAEAPAAEQDAPVYTAAEGSDAVTRKMVDTYCLNNVKLFGAGNMPMVRAKLMSLNKARFYYVISGDYKDPVAMQFVSIATGSMGIDRFMLGDTGMGVLKLLTGGLCGILAIIDMVTIQGKVKDHNFKKLMQL